MFQFFTISVLLTLLCASPVAAMPLYTSGDVQELERLLNEHLSASDRLEGGAQLPALIAEHARLTLEAVNAAPWREALTSDLVRAYILPPRVTEEPLEAWRAPLRASLLPLLEGVAPAPPVLPATPVALATTPATNPDAAALLASGTKASGGDVDARKPDAASLTPLQAAQAIRTWMTSRAVPGASHPWDLGPLGLLATGSGRCEELGILFICAARALGLPARICYTPAWRDTDGNHLWVEVWDGDKWQPFSIEQSSAPAGTGWFLPHVDATALVLAKGFGPAPASETDEILRSDRTGFLINRTAAYTTTGSLRLPDAAKVPGVPHTSAVSTALNVPNATAVPGATAPAPASAPPLIQVYVYNGQRPRPIISSRKAGQNITLGTGTYLVSVATEVGVTYGLATVEQGQTTTLPTGTLAQTLPSASAKTTPPRGNAPLPRKYNLATLGAASATLPPHVPQALGFTPPRTQHLPTAPGPQPLPLPASATPTSPLHLSTERIDTEPASLWREVTAQAIRPCIVPENKTATAKNINSWAAQWPLLPKEKRAELGTGPLSIKTMVEGKVCGSAYERVLLTVAALRSASIPAKLAHLGLAFHGLPGTEGAWGPWVEFYDGSQWLPLYPADPAQFGKKNGSLAAKEYYGLNLSPALSAPDKALLDAEPARLDKDQSWHFSSQMRIPVRPEWGDNWTLCRMAPNGSIVPVFLSTQEAFLVDTAHGADGEQGKKTLEVPPSERYVIVW